MIEEAFMKNTLWKGIKTSDNIFEFSCVNDLWS
jgi:hypothetical protein